MKKPVALILILLLILFLVVFVGCTQASKVNLLPSAPSAEPLPEYDKWYVIGMGLALVAGSIAFMTLVFYLIEVIGKLGRNKTEREGTAISNSHKDNFGDSGGISSSAGGAAAELRMECAGNATSTNGGNWMKTTGRACLRIRRTD